MAIDKEKLYKYVSVVYDDDIVAKAINEPSFYYKTDIENISVDDKVLVDRSGKEVVGIVTKVEYFKKDNAPYPLEKTKDIIKITEKVTLPECFLDSYGYHMLVIHDSDLLEKQLKVARGFVIRNNSSDIKDLINKSNIIVTVGNIDITDFDLSEKFVVNINNENNSGQYTTITYLSTEEECIQFINTIDYSLFYSGIVTNDLYDIENSICGKIKYKRFSLKEKEKIYEEFDTNSDKKMFILFETTLDSNLFEVVEMVEELRNKFTKCNISFGGLPVEDVDELKINIFFEI